MIITCIGVYSEMLWEDKFGTVGFSVNLNYDHVFSECLLECEEVQLIVGASDCQEVVKD